MDCGGAPDDHPDHQSFATHTVPHRPSSMAARSTHGYANWSVKATHSALSPGSMTTKEKVKLSIGGSVHDPSDPVSLLFKVLAMDADRIRIRFHPARAREGMQVVKAKGRLRGKQPKLSRIQEAHVSLDKGGNHTTAEIAALFNVARSTVYRIVKRTMPP